MVSYLPPAPGQSPGSYGSTSTSSGNTMFNTEDDRDAALSVALSQIESQTRAFINQLQQRLAAERHINEQMKLALNQPNIAAGMEQMGYGNHQWTSGPAAFARGDTVRVPAYDGGGVAIGTLHRFSTSSSSGGRNRRETWGVWNGQSWVYFGEDNAGASAFARALQSGQLPPGATSMDTGPVPPAPSPFDPYGEPVGDFPGGGRTRPPAPSPFDPYGEPVGDFPGGGRTRPPAPAATATPVPPAAPAALAAQESPPPAAPAALAAQESPPPPPPPPPPPTPSPMDPNYLHPGTAYVSGRPSTTYTGDGSIAPYGAAGVGQGPTVWLGGEGNTWFEAIYDPSSGSWVDVNTARGLGLLYQASGGRRGGRPGTNTRMDGSGEVIPEPPDWDPATGTNPVPSVPPPPPVMEPGVVRAEPATAAGAVPPPPAAPQQDPEYLALVERRRREREQAEKEAAYGLALADVRELNRLPPPPPGLTRPSYAKGGIKTSQVSPHPVVKVKGARGNAVVGEGKMAQGHRAEIVVMPDAKGVYVAEMPLAMTLPPGTKLIPVADGTVAQQTAKKLPPAPGTPLRQTGKGQYSRKGDRA